MEPGTLGLEGRDRQERFRFLALATIPTNVRRIDFTLHSINNNSARSLKKTSLTIKKIFIRIFHRARSTQEVIVKFLTVVLTVLMWRNKNKSQ